MSYKTWHSPCDFIWGGQEEQGQGWYGRMWRRQERRKTGRRRQETEEPEGGKDDQMRRWRRCWQHLTPDKGNKRKRSIYKFCSQIVSILMSMTGRKTSPTDHQVQGHVAEFYKLSLIHWSAFSKNKFMTAVFFQKEEDLDFGHCPPTPPPPLPSPHLPITAAPPPSAKGPRPSLGYSTRPVTRLWSFSGFTVWRFVFINRCLSCH